jgi:adenine-specific DNA-methyltransferase
MASAGARQQQLGQFFTTNRAVQDVMLALVRTEAGNALEPSAGAGDLVQVLEQRPGLRITAVEYDDTVEHHCASPVLHADFFTFAAGGGPFDVVFGNPPYVAWKSVDAATRAAAETVRLRYSAKTNLYHLFIDRCVDLLSPGGEMVLIVPKEWLYTTSAAPLRTKIATSGAVTHIVDCGEEKLFADADVPALMIFRFERGAAQGDVAYADFTGACSGQFDSRALVTSGDSWLFLDPDTAAAISSWGVLGEQYGVHVGLVTGLDAAFRLPARTKAGSGVVHQVTTKRRLEPFVDDIADYGDVPEELRRHLRPHKSALLARRIARFDRSNWWRYGAVRNKALMASRRPRFFALAKTRSQSPFFTVRGGKFFSGGVLGLFKRPGAAIGMPDAVRILNSSRYRQVLEAMSLTSGDKVSLQPATLERAPFPRTVVELESFLAGT